MVLSPAAYVKRGRPLRTLALLVLLFAVGGCGSASKEGSPAASVERGAIPPEWAPPQQAAPGGPAVQPVSPAKTAPATPDASGEATVVAAVDRYQDIISRFGGQAEVHLDFSGTAITDGDLARLPLPETVRSIDLSRTQIGDAGLAHLRRAARLERLSLQGTQVTAAAASILKEMPYLWEVGLDQSKMPIETQLELLRFFSSRAEARTRAKPR